MKYEYDPKKGGHVLILNTTGKKIQANQGLLSIDHDGEIFEGYDGPDPLPSDLKPAERQEIALTMIARWAAWALLALALAGCAAPVAETPAPHATEDVSGEPWRACLLDRPVCVEAVYCDANAMVDDERCAQASEGTCLVRNVPDGEECLDTARASGVGHCRAGACH